MKSEPFASWTGPHVAIVVPFHREKPSEITQCLASVRAQSVKAQIIAVGDGPALETTQAALLQLRGFDRLQTSERAHADFGNWARMVGGMQAMHDGADLIGFLDADNWLSSEHVRSLLNMDVGPAVLTATRTICRVDGSVLYVDSESNGKNHVDTSCLMLERSAFGLLPLWGMMPPQLGVIGDRIFWQAARKLGFASLQCEAPTVFYRSRYAAHYEALGEAPPPGAKGKATAPAGKYSVGAPFNLKWEI
jgi:glycosyltransferase involved in cell wall biosynthesis